MKTLTVFTPTYNRAHTLGRVYDSLCRQTSTDFEWMIIDDGSTDGTKDLVHGFCEEQKLNIHYIYKENGGLYTGYNVAYENIKTELCVCIDSDDYMPDDAVEKIVDFWNRYGSDKYAGLLGLDYNVASQEIIGGKFPEKQKDVFFYDLTLKHIHSGDTKPVMRTALMKEVAPQIGFRGEKNFNPVYMMLQVCDNYPVLLLNEVLCNVEYQVGADSMSQGIWKQYLNSPKSFAKLRLLEMSLKRNTFKNKIRVSVHYVASCFLSKDKQWLCNSPLKILTVFVAPFGLCLALMVLWKNK